jgi:hypothetical protein
VELIKRIVVGAEIVRHPALPSNGAVEHSTKCDTIDRACVDAEANDPSLLHPDSPDSQPVLRRNLRWLTRRAVPTSIRDADRPGCLSL